MCKSELDIIIDELQMMTGEVVQDINYLVARVLVGSSKYHDMKKEDKKFVESGELFSPSSVDLDSWFDSIEEGGMYGK